MNPGVACVSAYSYDAENRLVSIAGGSYTYDGDGKRVKKDGGATAPTLYWTGTGSDPLAESDLSGNVNEEFIFLNGKRIARLDLPSGTVHYYFSDHLGSTSVVADAQGTTIEQESDYYPFGGERVITAGTNAYKFTGKERDTESGLDSFGARFHSSALGRFTSPDAMLIARKQLNNPQDLNLYPYSINNPLRYYDPDGKDWQQVVNDLRTFAQSIYARATIGIGVEAKITSGGREVKAGAAYKVNLETSKGDLSVSQSVDVGATAKTGGAKVGVGASASQM